MITNGQNAADAVAGDISANDSRFSPGGTTADFLLGDLFRIEWSRIHMMLSLELEYTG